MYNPSDVGKKGNIFGLPYSQEESDLIFLPIHLDVTVSYAQGTSKAPDKIVDESSQLDLSLPAIRQPWELKMAMEKRIVVKSQNEIQRGRAINIIKALEAGKNVEQDQLDFVNEYCDKVHTTIEQAVDKHLESKKIVAVIGGDHSSPLGLIRALAAREDFGILQIDAHMDLRHSYEGFKYSHASIMYNALKEKGVQSLTQVAIRDFCEEEEDFIKSAGKPIHVFYDEHNFNDHLNGKDWKLKVEEIVSTLPTQVYISFDMDGLDPSLCPHTGTPVPGGLSFNESIYLIEQAVRSGRKIIGFDVCETGNHIWDANVAARIIYRIATLTAVSQDLLEFRK